MKVLPFFCRNSVEKCLITEILLQIDCPGGVHGVYFRYGDAVFSEKIGEVEEGFVFADVGVACSHAGVSVSVQAAVDSRRAVGRYRLVFSAVFFCPSSEKFFHCFMTVEQSRLFFCFANEYVH